MNRRRLLGHFVALVVCASASASNRIEVSVNVYGGKFQVSSDASTALFNSSENIDYSAYIGMRHSLYSTNGDEQNRFPKGFGKITSALTRTPSTGSTLPDGCYRGDVLGQSYDSAFPAESQGMTTAQRCWQNEPPAVCDSRPWQCDPRYFDQCPLVVNLGKGGWKLTGIDDGVLFDMDADGKPDRTSWTKADSTLAFVAIDINGNGTIDDASELIGETMRLPDGERAGNGFALLDAYDRNRDGQIDQLDEIWSRLLLWTDANHDGKSQPRELVRLAESEITALETTYHETHRHDQLGNELRYKSTAHMRNGEPQNYYDIFFMVH